MSLRDAWLVLAGLAIGFLGSWCGIGGGLFAVPLLHFVRKLELRAAVATALVLVLATSTAATAAEALSPEPRLVWPIIAALLPGVLVGTQLGYRLSERLSARRLRLVFAVLLPLFGARIVLGGGDATVAGVAPASAADLAIAFVVGVLGGAVGPLLGVGGGLVMVPGLYLGTAAVGFAGARAASLAVGVIGAARGLWLHARAGRVRWRSGLLLGAGALFGAALGVVALRDPRATAWGRVFLGILLEVVAVRFALDAWRTRKASAPPVRS
jgi:uncharacterized membrane protein YfcA